jgi:hypothetical protein
VSSSGFTLNMNHEFEGDVPMLWRRLFVWDTVRARSARPQRAARVHPGLHRRRSGRLDLSSIEGPGFGYRIDAIGRELPAAAAAHEAP